MSERETGRRGVREGMGQVMQDLVGHGEDLGFYLEGGGSPGGTCLRFVFVTHIFDSHLLPYFLQDIFNQYLFCVRAGLGNAGHQRNPNLGPCPQGSSS